MIQIKNRFNGELIMEIETLIEANLRGANLTGANLRGANIALVSITGIGSRKDTTYYLYGYDEVRTGCFHGTLEEFENKVHSDYHDLENEYRKQYDGAIAYFKIFKNK